MAVAFPTRPDPRKLTRSEWLRIVETGVFDQDNVELLRGEIVRMAARGPSHDAAVENLNMLLVPAVSGRARVRVQSAFAASDDSQPEPDLAIVPRGDYREDHPHRAHLIIEVALSSLRIDRTEKAALYAAAGVREYWVVNVVDEQIEVHTDIAHEAYARVQPFRRGERVTLLELPDVSIAVDDVFAQP